MGTLGSDENFNNMQIQVRDVRVVDPHKIRIGTFPSRIYCRVKRHRIPDLGFWIRNKDEHTKNFKALGKYDLGCLSRIRIFFHSGSGSQIQGSKKP